ncbi:uncharacterized protein LOC120279334 [Dioscorea cayenensis subsp. rotundata]|uniref:Uncharacterized protein LOC120279334 n=1 Tax=Dioscorea cayennensis subsp. rotundata TaxID=55577 RepID=A0AB40CS21_DIOCR|nr:uncharacterized protein LOC120279334 [Dioscorea cayenensis subsp. rotundata]
MIYKIDIEKAFDTIEWPVILATLRRMHFPEIWITWIKSCLSSSSFSFIVNGHHTIWIKSSRGVWQDDLILVTKASRHKARYCLICLNLYENLTGIKLGTFPFKYLGIPISPKHLSINQLSYMPDKAQQVISTWNLSSLSLAGRTTLLNSTVFTIPNYILSVMNLPVSILNSISKIAHNFL